MKVAFSSSFKRAFRKRIKGEKTKEFLFYSKLEVFINDPYHSSLKTHKLSGELKDLWSFSIAYDIRVVFSFVSEDKAVFIDIGKHDEVY